MAPVQKLQGHNNIIQDDNTDVDEELVKEAKVEEDNPGPAPSPTAEYVSFPFNNTLNLLEPG